MRNASDPETNHLSDEELVLAALRELPKERSAAIRQHLDACPTCLSNLTEIETAWKAYVQVRRVHLDAELPGADAACAKLQRELAAAGDRQAAPWFARMATATSSLRLALGVAALVIVVSILTIAGPDRGADNAYARFMPDSSLTPGIANSLSRSELCSGSFTGYPIPVERSTAYDVFRRHGVDSPRPRAYELDYLIPPELGGANDIRNLWPQPYDAHPWNAHAKDALEDRLLDLVCDGELDLTTAQRDLAQDWTAAYRRYFRVQEPLVEHASFLKDQPWE